MANVEILRNSAGRTKSIVGGILPSALEELKARIAPGAIHDSAEGRDAPKCQPETRVAIQDDLYDWILDGDGASESEHPRKIKWVTGPAGSGKTAIMGSLAGRCAANGLLGATFFFASWSASKGRRQKTAFVTTIASQLAEYREDLKNAISEALEKNPRVFEKTLHVQMEVLVLAPLREVGLQSDRPRLAGAIIIDGVDECEAEQYHDGSKAHPPPLRTNAQDQLEILQVLRAASSDPSFPFRILIASRPERVFREFFDPQNALTPFSPKFDLHEDYNAEADITLFFEVRFNQIRRQYGLPTSWPAPGTIQTLVKNASGQFIYAATVIRLLDRGHREPLATVLEAILATGATPNILLKPLEQLDALYRHTLESSPDPPLSVRWIRSIDQLDLFMDRSLPVFAINMLLQTESDEAEYLLGNLHSLIRVPPSSDQEKSYAFYHQSLVDFLKDPHRCGDLYVDDSEISVFIWERFIRACARGSDAQISYPPTFVEFLVHVPHVSLGDGPVGASRVRPTPAGVDWWVSTAIAHNGGKYLWHMFCAVHRSCPWYRCRSACRVWSRAILRHLGSSARIAPGLLWPRRKSASAQRSFERLVWKTPVGHQ